MVLRVSPTLSADQGQSPVLQIDPAKKRVTIREPFGNCLPQTAMVLGRDGKNLLKTFNFDATYSQESSQVWFYPSIDPRWCIWIGRLYVVSISMGFFFSLTNDLVWLISDLITSILFNHLQLLLTVSQPMRIYEMHFFVSLETLSLTVKMIHKTLTVLCSVRPGGGVRRRLGWRHPLCAQRQRRMRPGFGLRWCGWVIGPC